MRISLTLLLALVPTLVLGAERVGQGPLNVRSQNPGQSFRITSLPHDARGLPAGTKRIGLVDSATNIWGVSDKHNYKLDFQMNDAALFYRQGLTDRLTLGFGISSRRFANLHLDQVVIGFHDAVGLDQDGRKEAPRNAQRIQFSDYGVDLGDDELADRRISLSAEGHIAWQWLRGGNNGLSVGSYFHLRHEISNEALIQKNSTDGTLGMSLTWPMDDDIFYLNAGFTLLGQARFGKVPIREKLYSGMVSWEHQLSPNNSFYLQYLIDQQIFQDLGELSEPAHEIQFGWKWRRGRTTWQFAMVENLFSFGNSPDISFSLGVNYDFGASSAR